MAQGFRRSRLLAVLVAAAIATLGIAAIGMSSAQATTSVEGNCMSGLVPTATDNGDGTVTVTWTDGCTDLVQDGYYEIEVSTNDGTNWTLVATDIVTARLLSPPEQDGSYTDAVPPCGNLVYRVIAVHAPGKALPKTSISDKSNTVSPLGTDCGGPVTGTCNQLTGALTLGYYSNKNGQTSMTAADVQFLSGQLLVNYSGADQNWSTYAQFKNWLLNATAKNMSYMLSAQVATLELNIRHQLVDPNDTLCDVPGNPTIGGVVQAALDYIAANPQILGSTGDPAVRADGDALETLIDEINNDLVSVQ